MRLLVVLGAVGLLQISCAKNSFESECLSSAQPAPGDPNVFMEWLEKQYSSEFTPAEVHACLFGRLPDLCDP